METTVIIPWVRKETIYRAVAAAFRNAGTDVLIYPKEDKERIGCPKMVKHMVDKVKTKYVAFLGDDTIAQENYIKIALEKMKRFKDGIGLIGFSDKTGRTLCTHWLASMELIAHLDGEFFCTQYAHNCCDVELMERVHELGLYKYSAHAVVLHNHPLLPKINGLEQQKMDSDYMRVYDPSVRGKDQELLAKRRANGWK